MPRLLSNGEMSSGVRPAAGPRRHDPWVQNGAPRSPDDAAAIQRFDQRMALPLVVSAVVPLFMLPGGNYPWLAAAVFISSWVVFIVDLVFHTRHKFHFLRTWIGRFDLAVVVLTAPWFLVLPEQAKFVMLVRLARLARIVMATGNARRLFERVGRVALISIAIVFIGAAVAYRAEHPVNPEFATFGDALWWSIVTLTTVGYGDVVPVTTAGRIDGAMIMVTGVGVLGALAGSMASFFRLGGGDTTPSAPVASGSDHTADDVVIELQALRGQVERLTDTVASLERPSS